MELFYSYFVVKVDFVAQYIERWIFHNNILKFQLFNTLMIRYFLYFSWEFWWCL